MSDAAKRGLAIFQDKGKCIDCHGSPTFGGPVNTGILDVSFQERFPLLGGIVGLMMIWWIALVVVLHREVKTA